MTHFYRSFPGLPWRALLALLALVTAGVASAHAGGISCPFAELRVGNLQPGRVYVGSRDILGGPYKVNNKTDGPLDFKMVIRVPADSELQPGYEPIPDVKWISFEKAFFTAAAGEAGSTDFYISVPTGTAHAGKKYQAQLGVNTFGGEAFIQMGLMGRALLSVSDEPSPWTDGERRATQFSARMTLSPPALAGVVPSSSKWVNLNTLFDAPLVVRNDGDYPVRCRVEPTVVKESFVYPPPGFVPAPRKFKVKLRTRRFVVPPHSEKVLEGFVRIPKALLGKPGNYYIVLRAVTERTPGEVEAYTRLFFKGAP